MSSCPALRPRPALRGPGRPAALLAAMLLAATLWSVPAGRAAPAASPQATRAQLQSLRARIAAMARAGSQDAAERDRLTGQLRTAELSESAARARLADLQGQLTTQGAQRAALAAQRAQQSRALQTAQVALGAQLRAAYLAQRSGALRLLLEQSDPLASERLLTYFGYFGREQAARIGAIQAALQRLDALDGALAQQQASLTHLQQQQQAQLLQLSQARADRGRVLVALTEREHSRQAQLVQLASQQVGLARLLERLERSSRRAAAASSEGGGAHAAAGAPAGIDLHSPFGRLRGELTWPVSGRVVAQFGQQRASGVPWDGLVIATQRDTPVHAVSAGRVVYADWLPGLGLLMIVDHGNGYLSLYGHNDRLYQAVGAAVTSGEVIAAAGDTGGRPDPQLYFEIRRAGRPIDPLPWFRTHRPTP